MWAQLIKARVKQGREGEIEQIQKEFESRGNTGWLRSLNLRNQKDPQEYYSLVYFESEEAARRNERSPEQQVIIARLIDCFETQPEFVDLEPVYEGSR